MKSALIRLTRTNEVAFFAAVRLTVLFAVLAVEAGAVRLTS